MNKGLTPVLKTAFPDIIPVPRPVVDFGAILEPQWVAGFTDGEGCFFVNISKAPRSRWGYQIQLRFSIPQHIRDLKLMESLILILVPSPRRGDDCGKVMPKSNGSAVEFIVTKFSDIESKIIPFFDKYPLEGKKLLDFKDFCVVASLMKDKHHFTKEGLEQIKEIKKGMNEGRK